jgi:hypothetical protein
MQVLIILRILPIVGMEEAPRKTVSTPIPRDMTVSTRPTLRNTAQSLQNMPKSTLVLNQSTTVLLLRMNSFQDNPIHKMDTTQAPPMLLKMDTTQVLPTHKIFTLILLVMLLKFSLVQILFLRNITILRRSLWTTPRLNSLVAK